jgi:8-oxo-dGTP pyrophosphatase MutT (NUDIX family)
MNPDAPADAMSADKIFFISVTGIVLRDGKFLIVKRSDKEKAFPGRWTVPGGKMERADYTHLPRNPGGLWYDVAEQTVRREVREEAGLDIGNVRYVASIAYERPDGAHCVILSYACDHKSGDVKLCPALTEYAWVSLEEAKNYDLIEGIYDELKLVAQSP